MKKNIFEKRSMDGERRKRIEDLRDSLPGYLGKGWNVLQTPIVLDVDIIDILLVKDNGQLTIVKVIEEMETISFLGKMVLDYGMLHEKRHKLKDAYPDVFIDAAKKLHVLLFLPSKNAHFMSALNQVDFSVSVFTYMFIRSHDQDGIVLDKVGMDAKASGKSDDFDSMLRIMGENVRSEHSQYPVEEHQQFSQSPGEVQNHEMREASPQRVVPQEDRSIKEVVGFVEKATLTEEELIAFFDLEKKVDSYCNIGRNNPEK